MLLTNAESKEQMQNMSSKATIRTPITKPEIHGQNMYQKKAQRG